METKHTPEPWCVSHTNTTSIVVFADRPLLSATIIARTRGVTNQDVSNADHIVCCVNSHDALLDICKRLLTYVVDEENDRRENGIVSISTPDLIGEAVAAIAKATGGAV
jgi:hypothetical protein